MPPHALAHQAVDHAFSRAPIAHSHPPVEAMATREYLRDGPRVAVPRPEVQLIARFGPSARGGLDLHVLGPRAQVLRKFIRQGQGVAVARLRLGASAELLGVPGGDLAGRTVPLEDLWGDAATRTLNEQLAECAGLPAAASVLQHAMAQRAMPDRARNAAVQLATQAAARLPHARVGEVATGLGISDRHLCRVFEEVVGLSPKTYARLARFRQALRAARELRAGGVPHQRSRNWAEIAAETGYCDQAHLIDEFQAIAGCTPNAFLGELSEAAID